MTQRIHRISQDLQEKILKFHPVNPVYFFLDVLNTAGELFMMKNILRYLGQAVFYGLFVAVIGYFSSAPAYVHFPKDLALIKASFSHAGQPKEECHVRTADELAKLPPNKIGRASCRGRGEESGGG